MTKEQDVESVRNVIDRQGPQFIFDCLAECHAEFANKFMLTEVERIRLILSLSHDLRLTLLTKIHKGVNNGTRSN